MKRPSSSTPTLLLFIALLLFWLGERALDGDGRWVASGLAAVLFVGGVLGLGLRRFFAATGERRAAGGRLLLDYLVVFVAFAVYAAQSSELGWLGEGTARDVGRVLAAALLVAGLLPALAVELSLRSAGDSPQVEGWRIRLAERSARVVVLTLFAFAGANYAASVFNRKIDLSYFKTSNVGTANQNMVAELTQPVRFVLFFPPGNDVLEHVRGYLDELAAGSDRVKVEVADQALDPDLARDFKVRANGFLGIAAGERRESLRLGLELEAASTTLRQLDGDIQKLLIKVLRAPRIAYFTTGHLERDFSPPADDKRLGLADLRTALESLGFTAKRLGLGDGLGSQIPADATLVIVAGPIDAFLPAERASLSRWLDGGGRALFFLDPDQGTNEDELLAPLGVQVSKALIATDQLRHMWRESPYAIATNNTSSHPSVENLAKNSSRLGVALAGAGQVSKRDDANAALKITFTLRSMDKAWLDVKQNGRFDGDAEKRSTLDVGAAIEKPGADGKPGMRAVVFGDTDLVGDTVVRNPGNLQLVMDAVSWLAGDEKTAGVVESEKDVQIVHKKDEDNLWFYGSSVLMPASVLGVGLIVVRRRRRTS